MSVVCHGTAPSCSSVGLKDKIWGTYMAVIGTEHIQGKCIIFFIEESAFCFLTDFFLPIGRKLRSNLSRYFSSRSLLFRVPWPETRFMNFWFCYIFVIKIKPHLAAWARYSLYTLWKCKILSSFLNVVTVQHELNWRFFQDVCPLTLPNCLSFLRRRQNRFVSFSEEQKYNFWFILISV